MLGWGKVIRRGKNASSGGAAHTYPGSLSGLFFYLENEKEMTSMKFECDNLLEDLSWG